MLVGYARTSTVEQEAGLQAQERDLKAAGCERLFCERVSSVARRKACVDAPSEARSIVKQDAARDRVLPCVRPLLRHDHGRGPVWEFGDQVHITGTCSKHSPARLVLLIPPHRRCAIPVL